jgi:hypothetical protein
VDFETLSRDLRQLADKALADISAAAEPAGLEQLQIQYLGKKGELTPCSAASAHCPRTIGRASAPSQMK